MGKLGRIQRRLLPSGELRFEVDFRPHGRVFSIPTEFGPIPLADEGTARRVLESIRARLADGIPVEAALASFQRRAAVHVLRRAETWLAHLRQRADVGDLSPASVTEVRYQIANHWQRWNGVPVHAVTKAELDAWGLELAAKKLAPTTRRALLGYFRTFLHWIEDRGELHRVPRFPSVPVPEREPVLLTLEQQDAALETIPQTERGIYIAMVDLAIRPGEARALRASAVEVADAPGPDDPPAWVRIDSGAKGATKQSKVAGTKTGRSRRVPATERLVAWVLAHVDQESRVRGDLLFPSPRGGMYAHSALWRRWRSACKDAGVPLVSLRQASRHSTATDLLRKGAELEKIRRLLGHTNIKMTERYARWSDQALVSVMRPRGRSVAAGLPLGPKPPEKDQV
jgi:integrase